MKRGNMCHQLNVQTLLKKIDAGPLLPWNGSQTERRGLCAYVKTVFIQEVQICVFMENESLYGLKMSWKKYICKCLNVFQSVHLAITPGSPQKKQMKEMHI